MNDIVQIQGGAKARLPELADRSLGYCMDTEELFIGGEDGNVLLGSGAAAAGRFPAVTITANTTEAEAVPGMVFEDGGALKYKNLAGQVMVIGRP